jgi:hypothetical protein
MLSTTRRRDFANKKFPEILIGMTKKQITCSYSGCKNKRVPKRTYCRKHLEKMRDAGFKRLYGISLEERAVILQKQKNRCLICKEKFASSFSSHIDHDHVTGRIRGILCNNCNCGLGYFRDNPQLLHAAIEYLHYQTKV